MAKKRCKQGTSTSDTNRYKARQTDEVLNKTAYRRKVVRRVIACVWAGLMGLGVLVLLYKYASAVTPNHPQRAKPSVVHTYRNLPLHFEVNRGQANAQVRFIVRGYGYSLFLTPTEAVWVLRNSATLAEGTHARPTQPAGSTSTVLRMSFAGANPVPRVVGQGTLHGKSHYFVSKNPDRWRTNIPHYAKIRYEKVYPGIDLVFYGNQRTLEYDFIVSPGADSHSDHPCLPGR